MVYFACYLFEIVNCFWKCQYNGYLNCQITCTRYHVVFSLPLLRLQTAVQVKQRWVQVLEHSEAAGVPLPTRPPGTIADADPCLTMP
jgi:hypothetical protein